MLFGFWIGHVPPRLVSIEGRSLWADWQIRFLNSEGAGHTMGGLKAACFCIHSGTCRNKLIIFSVRQQWGGRDQARGVDIYQSLATDIIHFTWRGSRNLKTAKGILTCTIRNVSTELFYVSLFRPYSLLKCWRMLDMFYVLFC